MAVKIKKKPWLWCKLNLWNKATHNHDIKSQIMTKILKCKMMKYYDFLCPNYDFCLLGYYYDLFLL